MKESIGYTVTLNIIIVFITIVFAFLFAVLIYYKSNKASNIITTAIEKYEGYNETAENEINDKLTSIGYKFHNISCPNSITDKEAEDERCTLDSNDVGYCVYKCYDGEYIYYKIRTNTMINIPIIDNILNIPIYSNTNRLYNFSLEECSSGCYSEGECLESCPD